jgi:hypothetical protein
MVFNPCLSTIVAPPGYGCIFRIFSLGLGFGVSFGVSFFYHIHRLFFKTLPQ